MSYGAFVHNGELVTYFSDIDPERRWIETMCEEHYVPESPFHEPAPRSDSRVRRSKKRGLRTVNLGHLVNNIPDGRHYHVEF